MIPPYCDNDGDNPVIQTRAGRPTIARRLPRQETGKGDAKLIVARKLDELDVSFSTACFFYARPRPSLQFVVINVMTAISEAQKMR